MCNSPVIVLRNLDHMNGYCNGIHGPERYWLYTDRHAADLAASAQEDWLLCISRYLSNLLIQILPFTLKRFNESRGQSL